VAVSETPSPVQQDKVLPAGPAEEDEELLPRVRRVFLAHSAKDRAFVENELVPLLERHGMEAWLTTERIQPTTDWERTIRKGLESCDWFLLVMSPNSQGSRWVQNEVAWAFNHRPNAIVPVLIADCDAGEFHLMLTRIGHLDYRRVTSEARRRLLAVFGVELKESPPPPVAQLSQVARERQSAAQKPLKPADKQLTFMVFGSRGTGKTFWQPVVFDSVNRGIHPQIQTVDGPALRFDTPGGWFRRASSVQINLTDPSGELLENLGEAPFRRALTSNNGLVFFVDPLRTDRSPMEVISVLIREIQVSGKLSMTAHLKIPLAVCLSRIDLLRESLPTVEATRWLQFLRDTANDPANLQTLRTRSSVCEEILRNLSSANLAHLLRQNFSQVMFFPLTALGLDEPASGTSVSSARAFGVIEPILWLLEMNGYKALHGRPLWSENA